MAYLDGWKIAGFATLPARFVQGWIFWGGGSRRFIYDPTKLDPYAHEWMANKLQSAMPGAILGVNKIISYLLLHFDLLYFSVLTFSLIELLSGLGLIFGLFTRFAAFTTTLVSIILMLAFGWQGATCMDEWTMAVATLAMGFTLTLSGASVFSIDNLLHRRYSSHSKKPWFQLLTSGELPQSLFKKIAIGFLLFTLIFTLFTYNYYRGSIFTPYHTGPVSAGKHHISLSDIKIKPNGALTFTMYVDAGTPALPSNIIRIELLNAKKEIIENWDGKSLSLVTPNQIQNIYDYNQLHSGPYGLVAPLSSKAIVILSSPNPVHFKEHHFELVLFTINGERFESGLN